MTTVRSRTGRLVVGMTLEAIVWRRSVVLVMTLRECLKNVPCGGSLCWATVLVDDGSESSPRRVIESIESIEAVVDACLLGDLLSLMDLQGICWSTIREFDLDASYLWRRVYRSSS